MPRIFSFLMGVAAGAMLCFVATNYHVVRASDGFHLVHKQRARLAEAYVDVREFGVGDWSNHTDLAAALVAENKQYLMEGAAAKSLQGGLSQLPTWPPK
ncbi:MAG: hypothetical protein AB7G28_21035 [Pirellulales bacterium]